MMRRPTHTTLQVFAVKSVEQQADMSTLNQGNPSIKQIMVKTVTEPVKTWQGGAL
jgi:hypothetical protein